MVASRQARTIAGVVAVAVAAAAMSAMGSDGMRILFLILAIGNAVVAGLMVSKPALFFAEVEAEVDCRPGEQRGTDVSGAGRRQGSAGSEFSLLPTTFFERAAFTILGMLVLVLGIGLALGPLGVKVIMLGLSAYCFGSGWTGVRRGYNHRDRLLIMFGELSGAVSFVALVLHPFVGS